MSDLKDGDWKIFKMNGWLLPYLIVSPDGRVVGVAQTLRRARRVIRHEQERAAELPMGWWDNPVVYREPSGLSRQSNPASSERPAPGEFRYVNGPDGRRIVWLAAGAELLEGWTDLGPYPAEEPR